MHTKYVAVVQSMQQQHQQQAALHNCQSNQDDIPPLVPLSASPPTLQARQVIGFFFQDALCRAPAGGSEGCMSSSSCSVVAPSLAMLAEKNSSFLPLSIKSRESSEGPDFQSPCTWWCHACASRAPAPLA